MNMEVNLTEHKQKAVSFHDLFQRSLNSKFNSRPPKMQLSGTLFPCKQKVFGQLLKFKLITKSNEYFLDIKDGFLLLAESMVFEEVRVLGSLDLDSQIFSVEKIVLVEKEDSLQMPSNLKESVDIDFYKRLIHQRGKLEPEVEFQAS